MLRQAAVLLGLGLAAGSASGQCDPGAFLSFNTQAIRSQDAPIDVPSMAIAGASANVDLPLGTVAVGNAGIAPGGGPAFPLRVPVRRLTWRLITFAGVDAADLRVELSIDNGGALTALADSGSRVQVDVVNRTINANNFFILTVFEGFVDLLLDPSLATRAGAYSGTLNIEVDCA
jgi:hypothetical protein